MAVAIWKPGRRFFSSAAILMLLMAVGHTAEFLDSRNSGPRAAGWINVLWLAGFLIMNWVYRVPPPLIFGTIVAIAVAASLIDLRRYDERR